MKLLCQGGEGRNLSIQKGRNHKDFCSTDRQPHIAFLPKPAGTALQRCAAAANF
jgi:hypothetical protein